MPPEEHLNDADRLLAAFAAGSMLRPSQDALNIVDLGRTLAMLAGVSDTRPTPGSRALGDLVGASDHLVFIMVDGLGTSLLSRVLEDSFLAAHRVADLRTVFPSTTAAVLTSVATGEWPNVHAATGWWTHLEEIGSTAAILPFSRRSDAKSLVDLGVTPEQAFPISSLMSRIPRETLSLIPHRIVDSVYSTYASGGRERRGYRSLVDAVNIVIDRVRHAGGLTYTYLYTDRVDSTAHQHGIEHPYVRDALSEVDRQVQRLAQELDGRGRIVLTGDHGFLDVPPNRRHQIRASDTLLGLLRFPPSGDARVMYLHVRQGFEGRVRYLMRQRFGDQFLVLGTNQVEALELLGPGHISDIARSRVGDLTAISCGADVISYNPAGGVGKMMSQRSHHSGLTPDEMLVPLVTA